VSEFDDPEKKAEAYAEEHPEQAGKEINEVAGFAERDTDHQHDEQIDRAVEAAERHIGQCQDRQATRTSRKPADCRNVMAAVLRRRGLRVGVALVE
jgi:hypothetical protein